VPAGINGDPGPAGYDPAMDSERAGPTTSGPRRSRRRLDRRVLIGAAVAFVLVVLVVGVLAVVRGGGDDAAGTDEVRDQLYGAVAEAQATAPDDVLDVVALRARLEDVAPGWLIDLDAPSDRRVVGVAARQLDAPVCIFVWSAVGGPRTATVTDPNLPCLGAIARIAAE